MPKEKPPSRDNVLLPKQRMVEADAADKRLSDEINKTIASDLLVLNERAKMTYDGVVGTLPLWMPNNFHAEFEQTRSRVLNEGYKPQSMRTYIDELIATTKVASANSKKKPLYIRPSIPLGIRKELNFLAHIWVASQMDEREGLAFLTDQTHARQVIMGKKYGELQSSKAKRPRGKIEEADGETINEMIGRLSKRRPDESAKELWVHFHSKLDEHSLNPNEDSQKGGIEYDFKSKRKTITFGTFKKVVSQYRTGRKKLP